MTDMSAPCGPRPAHDRGRRPRDLWLVSVDYGARLAMRRPWRYAATWAVGIGAANLVLRILLNDLPLAQNARLAGLLAAGFFVFAWLYTTQLTRPLRRRGAATHRAVPATGGAAGWRCRPGRRSPTGRGPRSGALWACPRRVAASVKHTDGPSQTWRRLLLTAVAVAVVTVVMLIATAHAHATAGALVRLDHQTRAPGRQAPGRP